MDLVNYMKKNKKVIEKAATGMYAIAKSNTEEATGGVIFCLKQINKDIKPSENNPLNPYFLVFLEDDGSVKYNYIQSKKILDLYKKLCGGASELYSELIEEFNRETNNAQDMSKYAKYLETVVENIVGKEEEKGIESLFSFGATTLSNDMVKGLDDFELVSFLVVK